MDTEAVQKAGKEEKDYHTGCCDSSGCNPGSSFCRIFFR